jgi:hypothetical protein
MPFRMDQDRRDTEERERRRDAGRRGIEEYTPRVVGCRTGWSTVEERSTMPPLPEQVQVGGAERILGDDSGGRLFEGCVLGRQRLRPEAPLGL